VTVVEQVAEALVGGQAVGQCLGDPRWRHRTGLAQHTLRLRTWYALRSRIALGRSDIETIGMVYSSRSGRAPRGAAALR
jgi:hypothetical protein